MLPCSNTDIATTSSSARQILQPALPPRSYLSPRIRTYDISTLASRIVLLRPRRIVVHLRNRSDGRDQPEPQDEILHLHNVDAKTEDPRPPKRIETGKRTEGYFETSTRSLKSRKGVDGRSNSQEHRTTHGKKLSRRRETTQNVEENTQGKQAYRNPGSRDRINSIPWSLFHLQIRWMIDRVPAVTQIEPNAWG